MRGTHLLILLTAAAIAASAQDGPQPFKPLELGTPHGAKTAPQPNIPKDPATMYASRHEASIAALKAANAAAATHQNDRAFNLFLIAAKRDPAFATVLYDLGLLCARSHRWTDAESFLKVIPFIESTPELKKSASDELARVLLIASLENSPEGKRRMEFDIALVKALSMRKDPAVGADAATRLAQRDPSRWEAPAVVGLLSADMDHWPESVTALDTAVRLAPPERRPQLMNAREIARRQAHYQTLLSDGDQAWEKQEFGHAAKLYAEAWEVNPAATTIGLQAADGYLLDDQVVPAIECLGRLRQLGSDDEVQKATAMLQKLGAISDRAREMAAAPRTAKPPESGENPVAILARTLENVASPEMLLVAKPDPDLIEDATPFIALDDEELSAPVNAFLSTESIFAQYQKIAPGELPASPDDKAVTTDTPGKSPKVVPLDSSPAPPSGKPVLPNLDPRP